MKRNVFLTFFLFAFVGFNLHAQGFEVKGKVTSADDGSALPGVSVVVQGTTTGTVTDFNGNYSITVNDGTDKLMFSFVGMVTQEVTVNDRTVIDVVLEPAATELDEVIVTAVGISRQQKALGYSVVDVSADEAIQNSEPDLLKSLQGKIPGVDIRSSSGSPGTASRITIRGNSSFTGDNQPLFVVDGIPYSNISVTTTNQSVGGGAYGSGIATLDPNNIDGMSVLKGAAAAALYGSRGKNGVVLITTKSGKTSASPKGLEVTLRSSVNFETIGQLPEYQNTYGNGANFDYSNANGSWGPAFAWRDSIPTWSQDYKDLGFGDSIAYVAQPDNVNNLFQTGVVYDNSINIRGGNEKSSVNLTASSMNNTGYIPHSEFNRYSISVGGSSKLENGLKVNGSLSYTNSDMVGGIFGNNQASSEEAASSFARALWLGRTWIMDPYEKLDGGPLQPNGKQFDNPLWSWENNKVTTGMDRIVGNLGLSYDITDWLSASYTAGVNKFIQNRKQVINIGSRGYEELGGIVLDDYAFTELESNFILTLNKDLGDKLNLTAIAGHNVNQRSSDRKLFQGKEIVVPGIFDLNNTKNVIPYGGGISQRRIIGAYGDITLGYDNFLYLNASGRNDWSSTLPPENNSFFYPSASVSFLLTEAFEMLKSDLFNFGKLRFGYGKVGLDAPVYSIYDTYQLYNPILGQSSLYTPNTGYDPNLNPEFKTELEVGTQLAFFNSRVGIDFTWYTNTSTDLITPIDVAPSSGYTTQYTNVGELNNTGIELGLDLAPVRTNSFNWDIGVTFTKNRSEVISITEGVERATIGALFGDPQVMIAVGQPYGVFYGEVNATDDEGNLLIDKGTGLLIRDTELDYMGDPNPDFLASITNTFSFRGLHLKVLFDYRKGGDVYSNTVTSLLGRGVTKDTEDREKTVIIPGYYGDPNTGEPLLDGEGNKIPNMTQVTVNDLYFGESFAINSAGYWNIYDGTTLRVREVSIGYDLPNSIVQNTPFGGIMFSVTGRNLWYWAPNVPEFTNFDPDVNGYGSSNVQGVEYTSAPSVKRIGFNLKLSF
ncbi:MAG: SusC/RagA family TonB-linked outer membrane protein [Bacteroidales bacterium]